jgi:hypothetical protein
MIARRFSAYCKAVDALVIALMIAAACYQSEINVKQAIGDMRAVVSMYNLQDGR